MAVNGKGAKVLSPWLTPRMLWRGINGNDPDDAEWLVWADYFFDRHIAILPEPVTVATSVTVGTLSIVALAPTPVTVALAVTQPTLHVGVVLSPAPVTVRLAVVDPILASGLLADSRWLTSDLLAPESGARISGGGGVLASTTATDIRLFSSDPTDPDLGPMAGMDYRSEVMADSPLAYWRMDEAPIVYNGYGTVFVDQMGLHPGSWYASYNYGVLSGEGALKGDPNKAWRSYNYYAYMTVPYSGVGGATVQMADQFTYEAWILLSNSNPYYEHTLWTRAYGASPIVYIAGDGDANAPAETVVLGWYSAGGATRVGIAHSSVLIDDTTDWHHIVVTKSGSEVHIYIDGVDSTVPVASRTFTDAGTEHRFGNNTSPNKPLYGYFDELALYAHALDPARVLAHYERGHFGNPGILTAWGRVEIGSSGLLTLDPSGSDFLPALYLWRLEDPVSGVLTALANTKTGAPIRRALGVGTYLVELSQQDPLVGMDHGVGVAYVASASHAHWADHSVAPHSGSVLPAGTMDGDLMIASLHIVGKVPASTITAPPGWDLVADYEYPPRLSDGQVYRTAVYSKVAADMVLGVTPVMTSATTPSGVASDSEHYSTAPAWQAMGVGYNGWITNASALPQWIQYQFPSAALVTVYSIRPWWIDTYPGRTPKDWTLKGSNNGSDWTTIDTRTGWVPANSTDYVEFDITSPGSYAYYRLVVSANNGDSYAGVGGWRLGRMTYAPTVLAEANLAGYWRLGDVSGSVVDQLGLHHGTSYNGPTYGTTGLLSGDVNPSMTFITANDTSVVVAGSQTWWTGNGSSLALEAWADLPATTGTKAIAGFRTNPSGVKDCFYICTLGGTSTQTIEARFVNNGGTEYTITAVVTSGVHHFVLSKNGAVLTLYIDGLPVGENASCTGVFADVTTEFRIGRDLVYGFAYNGRIDEVAVYSSFLAVDRVEAHYAAGTAGAFRFGLTPATGYNLIVSSFRGVDSVAEIIHHTDTDADGIMTTGNVNQSRPGIVVAAFQHSTWGAGTFSIPAGFISAAYKGEFFVQQGLSYEIVNGDDLSRGPVSALATVSDAGWFVDAPHGSYLMMLSASTVAPALTTASLTVGLSHPSLAAVLMLTLGVGATQYQFARGFDLGGIGVYTVSRPFDLLTPPVKVTWRRPFDIAGVVSASWERAFDLGDGGQLWIWSRPFDLIDAADPDPVVVLPPTPVPINAVQRIYFSGYVTAGTYILSFYALPTQPIPYNADAAAIQAALEGLDNIDPGDITVSGGPLGLGLSVTLVFGGQYAGVAVPLVSIRTSFVGVRTVFAGIRQTFQTAITDSKGRSVFSHTERVVGVMEVEFDIDVPAAGSHTVLVAVDVSRVQSFWIVSDKLVTMTENDDGTPDLTDVLRPGQPYYWYGGTPNPFTVDIVSLKFRNSGLSGTRVQGAFLLGAGG